MIQRSYSQPFTAPATAQSGEPVQIQWTVQNVGDFAAAGSWTDSVYLATGPIWNISDPLIGQRARQMPDDAIQVYEKAVADEVLGERRRALNLLKRRGVLVVDAEPQELSVDLVARYLDVKGRSLL